MFDRLTMLMVIVMMTSCLVSDVDCLTRCFECSDAPHPADCSTTTLCSDEQKCMMQQYVTSGGLVLYRSGCMRKSWCAENDGRTRRTDLEVCVACCDGELCNNQGCGVTALPQPLRGPYCYTCPILHDPGACRTLEVCAPGEVCMVQEVSSSSGSGHTLFASSCISKLDCHSDSSVALIGKRGSHSRRSDVHVCYMCCHEDFCNDKCDVMTTQSPVTSGIMSTNATKFLPPSSSSSSSTTTTEKQIYTTVTATETTTVDTAKAKCELHGYTYVKEIPMCYKFHFESKYWDDGNNICKHEGGTLAIVDSQAKWAYLKPRIQHETRFPDDRIFIGLTDAHHHDHFSWVDGSHHHFTAWAPGQPDEGGDNCVTVAPEDGYMWHDMPCHYHRAFICTKRV